MLLSAIASSISFEQVMLLLLIVGMQLISVATLIHGINMAYRAVSPNSGNLLKTPAETKAAQDEAKWNSAQDRREQWAASRKQRRLAARQDRLARESVASVLDGERRKRNDV